MIHIGLTLQIFSRGGHTSGGVIVSFDEQGVVLNKLQTTDDAVGYTLVFKSCPIPKRMPGRHRTDTTACIEIEETHLGTTGPTAYQQTRPVTIIQRDGRTKLFTGHRAGDVKYQRPRASTELVHPNISTVVVMVSGTDRHAVSGHCYREWFRRAI